MPKRQIKSVTVTARLTPSVAKRLAKCAKLAGNSRSFLIDYILDRYLDHEIAEVEAILEGEADEKAGRLVPHEEAKRMMAEYVAEIKRQRRKAA